MNLHVVNLPLIAHVHCLMISITFPGTCTWDMEIEDALRLAGHEGSSLTRSFWFGKFLQLLSEEELIKHEQSLAHVPSTTSFTCSVSAATHNLKEELESRSDSCPPDSRRPEIAEALKCLKHCETSLSPNVYDLVVNSALSTPSEPLSSIFKSSFLLADSTLDWDKVSVHLDEGHFITIGF